MRDTAKEVALMALCSVQREYGAKLHPNLAKDVQIAIEGLRSSMGILDPNNIDVACTRIKLHLAKLKEGLQALRERTDEKLKNDIQRY
jgi:hypothetical protein